MQRISALTCLLGYQLKQLAGGLPVSFDRNIFVTESVKGCSTIMK